MSNKRISELPDIGTCADGDYFVVVDVSEENIDQRTKKISYNELQEQMELEIAEETIAQLVDDFAAKAFKDSPALEGTPTAPTPAANDNSNKLATTAYVDAADALKAPLASPTFTGNPVAPTQSQGNNSTRIATTAYVDTLGATKAPLASPNFSGTPTAPTPTTGDSSQKLATTAFVQQTANDAASASATPDASSTVKGKIQLAGDLGGTAAAPTVPALAGKAPLASPAFTGSPTAPTQTAGDNSTKLATTAFVDAAIAPKAPLASPAFTGSPTAPTQAQGDNTTKVATTAFVKASIDANNVPQPSYVMPALNIDWTAAKLFKKNVDSNASVTFSNPVDGKEVKVILKNTAASGSVVVDVPAMIYGGQQITIPEGDVAVLSLIYDGSDYHLIAVAILALV